MINENKNDPLDTDQFPRVVKKIISSDQLDTFTYGSLGINTDPTKIRPLTWKKQTADTIINGVLYPKSRPSISGRVVPNSYVIKKILEDDTSIYVSNAFPLFTEIDSLGEDKRNIKICETREISPAIATCIVSSSSSITSIQLSSGGIGYAYTSNPTISVSKSAIIKKDPVKDWKTVVGLTTSHILNSVDRGNVFVAVGNSGAYSYSSDGNSWTSGYVGFGNTISFNKVSVGGTNTYLAVGEYGYILKSVGSASTIGTWTKFQLKEESFTPQLGVTGYFDSPYSSSFKDAIYNPTLNSWTVVGVATAIGTIFGATGIGTTTLIRRFTQTTKDLNSLAIGLNQIIAVGADGVIVRSVNNRIWDNLGSVTFETLNKVIFVNGRFIVAGNNGTIIRSANYWNSRRSIY